MITLDIMLSPVLAFCAPAAGKGLVTVSTAQYMCTRFQLLSTEESPLMLQLESDTEVGTGKSAIMDVTKAFEDIGYHAWAYRTVCSTDSGLPHRRQRVYICVSYRGHADKVLYPPLKVCTLVVGLIVNLSEP